MSKPLHITIAAVPNTEFGNPRILEHELRLAKASILYADKTKLCSMTAWTASMFYLIRPEVIEPLQFFEFLYQLAPLLAQSQSNYFDPATILNFHSLLTKNPILRTKKEKILIKKFLEQIPEIFANFTKSLEPILTGFGFDEIKFAVEKGLLELQPFEKAGDELPNEYFNIVCNILESTETHPLLDSHTNDLVRLGLEAGKLTVGKTSLRKSKQIGLIADLFDRLPVFDVEMNTLFDIRTELAVPLTHFRSQMSKLSNEIESSVWDEDFPADVQQIVQENIEPALLDIDEKIKSIQFKDFWSRRIVDKYGYLAGTTALSFTLGATIAPFAGVLTGVIGTGLFVKASKSEKDEKISEIEKNGLYFYHQLKSEVNKRNK